MGAPDRRELIDSLISSFEHITLYSGEASAAIDDFIPFIVIPLNTFESMELPCCSENESLEGCFAERELMEFDVCFDELDSEMEEEFDRWRGYDAC